MSKYKSVTFQEDVEIDLDDFSTDDLFQELNNRIKKMNPKQQKEFSETIAAYTPKDKVFKPATMVNEQKFELFKENIDKKTLPQFESFFNQP